MNTPRSNPSPLAAFFSQLHRWLLLGALVYAPWAYASTPRWSAERLAQLLGAMGVCFVVAQIWQRRWPRIPLIGSISLLGLLLLGWWMTFNVYSTFDPADRSISPTSPLVAGLPGTRDYLTSFRQLCLVTGFAAAFFITCDMVGNRFWRERLWFTLALVGLSILLLGLAQRLTGAMGIFWNRLDPDTTRTFFGTFYYHGNAGAFINLIIPLTVGRAVLAFRDNLSQGRRAFWSLASLVSIASAFVNVSRAAMVITIGLLVLILIWLTLETRKRRLRRKWELWLGYGAAITAIVVLATSFGLDTTRSRWMDNPQTLANNPRYLTYDAIIAQGLPAAGWAGFGPGTFHVVFPLFSSSDANIQGYWHDAHQDYLQTLLEWGWIGSALWAIFLFGGLGLGLFHLARNYAQLSLARRIFLAACCMSLVSIYLHGLCDFPLQIPSLQLYVVVLLGCAWSLGASSQKIPRRVELNTD